MGGREQAGGPETAPNLIPSVPGGLGQWLLSPLVAGLGSWDPV